MKSTRKQNRGIMPATLFDVNAFSLTANADKKTYKFEITTYLGERLIMLCAVERDEANPTYPTHCWGTKPRPGNVYLASLPRSDVVTAQLCA